MTFRRPDDTSPQERPKVCIIGSGAAGITLACEFDGEPYPALLIEAGSERHDAASVEPYQGEATPPHPATTEFRRLAWGGTTAIWGGRCVPYDPIDFEPRSYLPDSGWPIAYSEVTPFYQRAMDYCDAGKAEFTAEGSLADARPLIPGLEGRGEIATNAIERYSLPTHFGNRYRARLAASKNVSVRLDTRCVRLLRSADGAHIESIEVVNTRSGAREIIEADTFVLATGGIETPRLLLASGGIGNAHDVVGRYYACHFENTIGRLVAPGKTVKFDFEKTRDGVYCRRKLIFTAEAMRSQQLLNSSFRLHFPNYSDASHGNAVMSAIFLAKTFLIPEYRKILQHSADNVEPSSAWAHFRNVITGLPQLFRFAWIWLFQRVLATRKLPYTLAANADGSYPIEFNCEQTPLAESRVSLTSDTDAHGVPRVKVDWKLHEPDVQRACRGFSHLAEIIGRNPGMRLDYDAERLEALMRKSVPLGGHHIGTTRMGATAAQGVVDGNCAVFDAPNLFIASSSVFPTSSHANPTLTIVALALRLAGHLKGLIGTAR